MRSIRTVCVALVAVSVLCVASQADASLRRSRGMRTAYAPFPPVAEKKSADKKADATAPATKPADKPADKPSTDKPSTDKKADATPSSEQPTTTRRRGLFKRRYVTQAEAAVATPVAETSSSPFRMVSDPTPAPSATPPTPAPAPEAKASAKPKRRLFARWRARRGKA